MDGAMVGHVLRLQRRTDILCHLKDYHCPSIVMVSECRREVSWFHDALYARPTRSGVARFTATPHNVAVFLTRMTITRIVIVMVIVGL